VRTELIRQINAAVRQLDPDEVRAAAARPLSIGLAAASSGALAAIEDFLAPPELSHARRTAIFRMLHRAGDRGEPRNFDFVISEAGLPVADGGFAFFPEDPSRMVKEVLSERSDLRLALASNFPVFRGPAIERIIYEVARENALFAVFAGLPGLFTPALERGWVRADVATDTLVLTVNQVRMAFLIAAASGHEAGLFEQRWQIAAIVTGGFGCRALARNVAAEQRVSSLAIKGAIAYAGTCVVGVALERHYRQGRKMVSSERSRLFRRAFERGLRIAEERLAAGESGESA
jgi:hypothetical protein